MQDRLDTTHSSKRRFAFLIASARRDGNTELLTRRAAASLPADYGQLWIHLMDLPLSPFEDIRHSVGVYPQPTGNERILFDATLQSTDIVFSVPLYWYSVPTSAKHYLDYWSAWLRVPGADFRKRMAGKTLWGVCVLSEEDQGRADPLLNMLANTADYLKMGFGGVLLGYGSRPGDVMTDAAALTKALTFFRLGGA
jgi:multimeric flavodoxin WrbA